ncbi:MAG: hypothetical protein ABGW87_07150 [Sphingomonadaceae bacterium]
MIKTPAESQFSEDLNPYFQVRIPDHLECLPPRARRNYGRNHVHPLWSATTLESHSRFNDQVDRHEKLEIYSIDPYYHITHRRKQFTFAFLSRKNGRTQTGESWWEYSHAKRLEVDPEVADYQLGGFRITWRTSHGIREYTPDAVRVDTAGAIAADEVKASASYFHEPEYSAQMKRTNIDLAAAGICFNMIDGEQMLSNRRYFYNVAKAFDDRFAKFGDRELDQIHNVIRDNDAGVELGRIANAMQLHAASAMQIVNAMMCKGLVVYDLNYPANLDTIVRLFPKLATPLPDIRSIQI